MDDPRERLPVLSLLPCDHGTVKCRSRLLPYCTRFSRKRKVPTTIYCCGNDGNRRFRAPLPVATALITPGARILSTTRDHHYKLREFERKSLTPMYLVVVM